MAVEILAFLPGLLMLALANYTEKRKDLRILTQVFLSLLVVLVILMGLLVAISSGVSGLEGYNTGVYGGSMVVAGLLSLLFFIKPVRAGLANVISIETDNWLHATALVFAVLLVGLSLATALTVDVTKLGGTVDVASVVLQDVFFIITAMFGVGWLTRRDWKGLVERLGLRKLTFRDLGMSIFYTLLLFVIVIAIGMLSIALGQPSDNFEKEDPTIKILGGVTWVTAIIFALGAGFGEEILFRGAIQPRFGIILTSAIFALMHIQYMNLMNMATLFGIGAAMGYERKRVSTTACIISHTVYDFMLFLMLM